MKRAYFILLLLTSIMHGQAQTKSQPRLHNWIATFMPGANAATIRHVMVMSDGTLRSWQAGETPAPYTDINDAVAVTAGDQHLLILRKDGTVWSIGDNSYYQLGNEKFTKNKGRLSETPIQVTDLDDVIAVSAVRNSSYALLQNGTVWAWGDGNVGMMGDGGKITSSTYGAGKSGKTTPVQVKDLENVIAISGAMALRADGTVWTWGDGYHGRLGNNSTQSTSTPVQVQGITNAVAITSNYYYSYALLEDGTIRSWGYNYKGQLGNGVNKSKLYQDSKDVESWVPVKVVGITNAVDIDANSSCLILLKTSSVMGCGWGNLEALGPLGDDATPTPVKVFDLKNVVAVKAGTGFGFALLKDGTLLGWGANMVKTGENKVSRKVITIASFGELAPKPRG